MAVEARPELVGKRFLCVSGDEPPGLEDISRWLWRSGVIRAVNHRDSDSSELAVYVEFDDQEWDKREWVKVYEDFQLFLLEHQLVWAKRKEGGAATAAATATAAAAAAAAGGGAGGLLQGTKVKHIQWPALAFKPVVGKNLLSSVTAVEFLLDRQLDFLSDHSACQPYQDEVDSQNPVFRDNPQLLEEVKVWLKDQKVQEIFMQGPYSLNGYRVRVYRQDSATQWFTGIITHHDLFSRNMVVMNDQVLEPQNVDPSMIQMTFLDDVVHSLLKGENIGITSRRRSRSSQNNNSSHSHYTRAQANSPRPVMTSPGPNPKSSQGGLVPQQQSQLQQIQQSINQSHHSPSGNGREPREHRNSRSCRRKGSDSSVPEEDGDRREETVGQESKMKVKLAVNKRRKDEEDEKKSGLKRLKPDMTSDLSESSDSENPHKTTTPYSCSSSSSSSSSSSFSSSSEPNSENELKSRSSDVTQSSISRTEEEEKQVMKGSRLNDSPSLIGCASPWVELQPADNIKNSTVKEPGKLVNKEEGDLVTGTRISRPPTQQTLVCDGTQSGHTDNRKNITKAQPQTQSQLHSSSIIDITDDAQATVHRESSEAVSALLASQSVETIAFSPYLPLNPSPVSSPPIPPSPSPSEGCRRVEMEPLLKQPGSTGSGITSPKGSSSKTEFAPSEVIRPVTSIAETVPLVEKKDVLSHHHLHRQQQHKQQLQHYTPFHHGDHPSVTEEMGKQPPHKLNTATPPDSTQSRLSPNHNSVQHDSLRQSSQHYSNSPVRPYSITNPADHPKTKPPHGLLDISKPKPNTSPEVSKHKLLRYSDTSPPPPGRVPTKVEPAEPLLSDFKPLRSEASGASSTKSPLIIDKNESFTVYRDPALVRSDADNAASSTNSSNHVTAYLHPHLHTLHPPSPHSPCLTPASHAASHLLASPHSTALPHAHLLPPGMLPAMPPPAASLFGGHPRLDSPGALSHLALPHQQQFIQGHASAAGLGLYPIIWQYSNGTAASYPPGLNLQPTSKWVHSENPVTVNSDGPLRRNTASPWLHPTAVNAGDGLGLMNHIPVRPASADPYRSHVKINPNSSPPMSKTTMDVKKEDMDKKSFVDPIRTLTLAQLGQDQMDRSRTPTGKDVHLHRMYLDPHCKSRLTNAQEALQTADRANKYKKDNHQILKESLEVAPFTAKIQRSADTVVNRDRERRKDQVFPVRVPPLASQSPKTSHTHPHVIQTEKSGYYTTLSNSIVNEPPRLYPSKEGYSLGGSVGTSGIGTSVGTQSSVNYTPKASLSKPPPLIKHHPEGGEGLAVKITEQLNQQVTFVQPQHHTSLDRKERYNPAISPPSATSSSLSSVSNHHHHHLQQQQHQLRAMPSLYRAPVYHPPTQFALERKEPAEQEKEKNRSAYGGRLSPPTLTPIQPVALVTSGTKASIEQQKPPTLVPELRDIKGHGITAAVISMASTIGGDVMADRWRKRETIQERESVLYREKEGSKCKPQAAMASVIVRPTTAVKYESPPGMNKSSAFIPKEFLTGRLYPSKLQEELPRFRDGVREPGAGRVIQSSSNLDDMSVRYKNSNMHGIQSLACANTTSSFCRSAVVVSSGVDVQNETPKSEHSTLEQFAAHKTGAGNWVHIHSGPDRENHEGFDPTYTSPGLSSPITTSAGTPLPSQNFIPAPSSISGSGQPYSSFVHPKKLKAALAAAQSRSNLPTAPASSTAGNSSLIFDLMDKTPNHSSTPPPCLSQVSSSSGDSNSNNSAIGSASPEKTSPLPNGQSLASASVSCGQPINYHKLKKAWLTRHSEEDRNITTTVSTSVTKAEKLLTTMTSTCNTTAMTDMIKPCTVNLCASTSNEVEMSKDSGGKGDKERQLEEKSAGGGVEEKKSTPLRRGNKRSYDSGSESGGDDSDASESKMEGRAKRQPKPTYKKKQNDMAKKKGDTEKEEDDVKPNGIFRSAREKTKLKLASSNGIPRSVLKDWRKVKKLKQTGESFLQDDSCSEIGPNLQKCRECRVFRSKKSEEPAHSPVFCRFYYFRRLSHSKNGVLRMNGFSTPDQFDDEALALWVPGPEEESHLDQATAKYILTFIGDKFCQMVMTENTAATWIKKDGKLAWKRAVRGVREMCDACEATLFNIHWVCQKCGFVVCLDCYKAKERRSSKDKELYGWLKCVKGQPHDHKHLMPTQIIPGKVLAELVTSMHSLRDKHNINSHCPCTSKQNVLTKLPATNGISQVLQNVLNHSNKLSLKAEPGSQQNSGHEGAKAETNGGGGGGGSSPGSDAGSVVATPPASHSPLHFIADLAEQKSREGKKENKEAVVAGKAVKEEKDEDSLEVVQQCKTSSLMAHSAAEQGSTLRDLLTTTAGKLKLGSTDAGIAFAPVYSTASQTDKSGRTMPNILDDIIASVVENKIPASRQNTTKLSMKQDHSSNNNPAPAVGEEVKAERKRSSPLSAVVLDNSVRQYPDIPHCLLNNRQLLWLKDHRNQNNWKLFRECWKQGQPVLVSGIHKRLNTSLWRADSFNQEFADHQGDLLNCRDQVLSNSGIKEFWDGFEDINKRPKSKVGEPLVYRLKDWPSGEEFMALMPSRYDDLMKNLPLPEYCDPEGNLNLASHLPSFFVRPDLGPRLCCAYGVAACQDQNFGTANLHVEVSDVVSVLVYVGVAKGNGVLSKTGVLKRLEEEDLDEGVRRRLKDSSETPGALWHIYLNRDMDKVRDFLYKLCKEQSLDLSLDQDPLREHGWYLSRKQRLRLLDEHGVQGWTVVQFLGDSVLLPAGAMHQVQNLHSCVQVINDFVSPEHVARSFHLTQELRSNKEEVNYEDKLQVKNILYHCVKEAVSSLKRSSSDMKEENS